MKIIITAMAAILAANAAMADDGDNTLLGRNRNQIGISVGSKFDVHDGPFVAPMAATIQYSQPLQVFRIDSRINAQLTGKFGKDTTGALTSPAYAIYAVQFDIAPISIGRFYAGVGVGAGERTWGKKEDGISKFLFGQKAFVGYKFAENYAAEF
ncbi:MAG: hypothetical protein LBL46_05020, partial [Rickettsiales bacterium]|nr:hypothetical protein [Rickettsiales bacterium]